MGEIRARANESGRNDPVLRQKIVDDYRIQLDAIKEAVEHLEAAQSSLRKTFSVEPHGDEGPGFYAGRMLDSIYAALRDAEFPSRFYNDEVLDQNSTYIRNVAAFEDPIYYED